MKKGVIIVGIIVLIGAVGGYFAMGEWRYRRGEAVTRDFNLKVYPDDTFDSVYDRLTTEGVIADGALTKKIAARKKLNRVTTGNYDLPRGMTYRTLLTTVALGWQSPIRLTFNNFRTTDRLLGAVARKTLADSSAFCATFFDKEKIGKKGFDIRTIISIFVPNTYEIYWTITPDEFLERMYDEYTKFWNDERRAKAAALGFTPAQISTIASIVDCETNKTDEMTNLAGVYINRLRAKMPLQADPTVKFALGQFELKRVLTRHLEVDSPYNTYRMAGLPPGPICMASVAALDATLNYTGHKYYYFCARTDFSGYHTFAANLSEHNENARKYHAELNRLKIK